jgi:hypothetical protein
MVRKAILLPVESKEVEWVRYTGDNFEEIQNFVNKNKTRYSNSNKFYLSPDDDKEIYWKEHGFIGLGDFVVFGIGVGNHLNVKSDGFAIISWKLFPRMIKEDIPIYLDEYLNEYCK